MKQAADESRRRLVRSVALGVALIPVAELPLSTATAAELPLLSPDDPAAKALKYVSDASQSPDAKGNTCATCSLYEGSAGSAQGGCSLFPGKAVAAAGWCASWNAM